MWTGTSRKLCQTLGINLPIIQAPMAGGPTTPELVAAVSNSGGLGSIGAGYLSPESLRQSIRAAKALTAKPFSVNLFIESHSPDTRMEPSDDVKARLASAAETLGVEKLSFRPTVAPLLEGHIDVLCEDPVAVVSITFGLLSQSQMARLRATGAKLVATATTMAEAQQVEQHGYDAVVLQGFEAGAHRGSFTPQAGQGVGLMALMGLAGSLGIPFIASGAIMTGKAIAASLVLGAAAVQMGTAFLTVKESGADPRWKDRLFLAKDTDTLMTRAFSGKLARGIRNEFIEAVGPVEDGVATYPVQNQITTPLRSAAKKAGNTEFMSLWGGQAASLARNITAAELMAELVRETDAVFSEMRSFSQ